MIQKKTISIISEVEVIDPNGKSMGMFNELELLDLRRQIVEHQEDGYYVKYIDIDIDGEDKFYLNTDGTLSDWCDDIFAGRALKYIREIHQVVSTKSRQIKIRNINNDN